MLSITKCKKILNKKGISYTDEEVLIIQNVLHKFAEVAHTIIEKQKHLSVISNESINSSKNTSICSKNIK
jgi:hypothetical protein